MLEIKFKYIYKHNETERFLVKHFSLMDIEEGKFKLIPSYSVIEKLLFTGLKDKNGVEIYEGDVVIWTWGVDGGTHIVRWKKWSEEMSEGSGFQFPWFCVSDKSCEVIGNIYENPELLESKKCLTYSTKFLN